MGKKGIPMTVVMNVEPQLKTNENGQLLNGPVGSFFYENGVAKAPIGSAFNAEGTSAE